MSQSLATRRYAFETVFDANGAILSEGDSAPIYTAEDLRRERLAGIEDGKQSEIARAEAESAAALAAIAAAVAKLTDPTKEERREIMRDASRLAIAAARKAAGAALEAYGEDRIVAALDTAFDTFIGAPRLVVRVAAGQDSVRARLEAAAADHGYAGALVVRTEAGLSAGDVALDWGDGALTLSADDAFRRIEAIVADHLSQEDPS